jgi:hypothetical protein
MNTSRLHSSLAFTVRKWPKPWMGPFLEALAQMPNLSASCRLVGIARSTAYRTAGLDPEFREAWREAIEIGTDLLERVAHQRATTGDERVETRRRVKRCLNRAGELVVVEEETITVQTTYVSDAMLTLLLKAYRPRRFQERQFAPGDDLEKRPAERSGDDGIHRKPTRERMLALAKLACELEAEP